MSGVASGLLDGAARCPRGVCCMPDDPKPRFTADGGVAALVPEFHGGLCGLTVVGMPAPPGSITVITSKVTNAALTPSALTFALGSCVEFGRRLARHAADGLSSSVATGEAQTEKNVHVYSSRG